ncbi:MAG TPA: LysR family transcriptional regulator [Burkholderiaceae bacterium]
MRVTLRQLQIFTAVADSGSTAAAADVVALSQSATSASLNELESVLGTALFDRVGKRLMLNDNGRVLLPQARQMLDAAATMERQFNGGDHISGLRLGASTTIGNYLLPHILAAAGAHRAGLHPVVTIANTAEIAAAVANFQLDLGLVEGPSHEAELIVEPWLTDELLIVASPSHPILAEGRHAKVNIQAMRDTPWLLRERGSGTRETVEHALLPHLHTLRPGGEFSNAEAIKHGAAAGLGLACLSRLVVQDLLATGALVSLETSLPPLIRHFFLIRHQRKVLSARLEQFLSLCRGWPADRAKDRPGDKFQG